MTNRSLLIAPVWLAMLLVAARVDAGPLDPPGEPAPTGVSLAEIAEAAALDLAFTRFNPDGVPTRASMSVMTSDGGPEIIGSDTVGGSADVIEVYDFSLGVTTAPERGSGTATGNRRIRLSKRSDATTPLLIHALCMGREMDRVSLEVFRSDPMAPLQRIELASAEVVDLRMTTATNADGNAVAIETLEISHEGLRMTDVETGLMVELLPDGSCTVTAGGM